MQAFSGRFLATSKTKFGFLVYKKMIIKGCRVWFTGSVQGVGFRYSIRHIAKTFEVSGYVKNLADGRVELIAEGVSEELDRFLDAVQRRFQSHILDSNIIELPVTNQYSDFSIRYG